MDESCKAKLLTKNNVFTIEESEVHKLTRNRTVAQITEPLHMLKKTVDEDGMSSQ